MSAGTVKPKVRIGRIVWCLCALLVAVAVAERVSGVATAWAFNRQVIRKNPRLAMVPVAVGDLKSSATTAEELEYFGAKFRTPWGPPTAPPSAPAKTIPTSAAKNTIPASGQSAAGAASGVKKIGAYTLIQFKDGQVLTALSDFGRNGLLDVLSAKNPEARKALEKVWGTEEAKSSYEVERMILYTTPQQVSIWKGWRRYWQTSARLNIKDVELLHGETELYEFAFPHVHGFQKGDPTKGRMVTLVVYDDKDRMCEIRVGSRKDAAGVVTQEDINAILGSMGEAGVQ